VCGQIGRATFTDARTPLTETWRHRRERPP